MSDADAYFRLGLELQKRCLWQGAATAFKKAMHCAEDYRYYNSCGDMLRRLWRFEEAQEYVDRGLLSMGSADGACWWTDGLLALDKHCPEVALKYLAKARELGAGDHSYQIDYGIAIAHLYRGEYLAGFTAFESRHQEQKQPPVRLPIWQGENLAGKSLLVDMEQGLGDALMFMRYLPELTEKCHTTVRVPAPLLRFFRNQGFETIPKALEIGADYRVNSMSIPVALSRDGCPPQIEMNETEHVTMLGKGKFRIGICWKSKATGHETPEQMFHGEQKSCPLEEFLTLAEIPGVELYSLQVGPAAGDIARAPHLVEPTLIFDLEDAAGYMHELDLIVSVDTAIAHLAGTLKKPTIVVLNCVGSWQWQLGDETPWYETVTIVRQPKPFDWKGCFAKVRELVEVMV